MDVIFSTVLAKNTFKSNSTFFSVSYLAKTIDTHICLLQEQLWWQWKYGCRFWRFQAVVGTLRTLSCPRRTLSISWSSFSSLQSVLEPIFARWDTLRQLILGAEWKTSVCTYLDCSNDKPWAPDISQFSNDERSTFPRADCADIAKPRAQV